MSDWAAKVLEGVPRLHPWHNEDAYIKEADALAAIARMGAGDDMVERLLENDREIFLPLLGEAAAHIAALTAQNREMALDVLASSGQAADAYAAQLAAEAERDALRAQMAENRISEPHDPGDFVGDIFYGHPVKTTMGTHRWTGTEWVALPSEAEALAGLLAGARKEAAALRERVARLEGALVEHNDLLRSALSIAKREGVDGEIASTNWDAYYNRVAVVLKRHHQTANDARAALTDGGKDG